MLKLADSIRPFTLVRLEIKSWATPLVPEMYASHVRFELLDQSQYSKYSSGVSVDPRAQDSRDNTASFNRPIDNPCRNLDQDKSVREGPRRRRDSLMLKTLS